MKWLIYFLSTVCSLGQAMPFARGMMAQSPPAAGGGGEYNGPPDIALIKTNTSAVSGTTTGWTNTFAVSGSDTAMFWFVDWYGAGKSTTPKWNNSTTGVTLWTNCNWYNDGNNFMKAWVLVNPSAGTYASAVPFSGAVDEATGYTLLVTNYHGLETCGTNFIPDVNILSNVVASASTDLMICYTAAATSPLGPTPFANQTALSLELMPGNSMHTSFLTRKAGTASTSTNGVSWDGTTPMGQIVGGIKGN